MTAIPSLDEARPSTPGRQPVVHYCTFCQIVARKEAADILYEDEDVVVFRNRLRWVPVMLLVVPREHIPQEELWRNMGRVGEVAVQMGFTHCPNGFRVLSNFGFDGMQSQDHGHVHVLGGTFLGEYA
jgi:histidine triad (HIT) family protein